MPDIYDKEFINSLLSELGPMVDTESFEEAQKYCDLYLEKKDLSILQLSPYVIYHVIKKTPSNEQVAFIRNNINFIRENEEKIFAYNMMYPPALSHYLSYDALKEISVIDSNIFQKILNGTFENFINGFSLEQTFSIYDDFFEQISAMKNFSFINSVYHIESYRLQLLSSTINDPIDRYNTCLKYSSRTINIILNKYEEKINSFSPIEILYFCDYIFNHSNDDYNNLINKNKEKIGIAFKTMESSAVFTYFDGANTKMQQILFDKFSDTIFSIHKVKDILLSIHPNILIKLYKNNKDLFNDLTLADWINYSQKHRYFDNNMSEIMDTYNVNQIDSLFSSNLLSSSMFSLDTSALRHIEKNFRNNIAIDGNIIAINNQTSIFSNEYLKNLEEFKSLLKSRTISVNDSIYTHHYKIFFNYLIDRNLINTVTSDTEKEVKKLFYRIVLGASLTILEQIKCIQDICLINRLNKKDFKASLFTTEQLSNYNVKEHKKLYSRFENSPAYFTQYKELTLKLMLIVGYQRANYILSLDDDISTLEHLVGNVDVKNIKLDKSGNPILNSKLVNLLFNDQGHCRIKNMLKDKNSTLYKYFPRIFNEWEMIKMSTKNLTLENIFEILKSDEIVLPPKYYRLQGEFRYIGCQNSIVNETLSLHDSMLERTNSTIPGIKEKIDDYSYEILRLDDKDGFSIGNKTNCCFTVLGNGYDCLKHALSNINGRILVIKKGNEILAHSWIWRNGNVLCLDNIEISKSITHVDFLHVYEKFADEIIKISAQNESFEESIQNVTIGFTDFDKEILGIKKFPCFISQNCNLQLKHFDQKLGTNRIFVPSLPQPRETVGYSDSKNVQYLIKGTGKFNLFQSTHLYQDSRPKIIKIDSQSTIEDSILEKALKKVNALRYIRLENEGNLKEFKSLKSNDILEIYCNDDWFIIISKNNSLDYFIFSKDYRAKEEFDIHLNNAKLKNKISKK